MHANRVTRVSVIFSFIIHGFRLASPYFRLAMTSKPSNQLCNPTQQSNLLADRLPPWIFQLWVYLCERTTYACWPDSDLPV